MKKVLKNKMLLKLVLALTLSIITSIFVYWQIDFILLPYLWLASILIVVIDRDTFLQIAKIRWDNKWLIVLMVLLLPAVIDVVNYQSDRFHQDDLITAFFSVSENFAGVKFFNPVPSWEVQWVAQFPSIYFVVQKFILSILGVSNLAVKLSVLPYQIIIASFLFKLVKKIFNQKIAYISVVLYAFLAISLYLTTIGLHFVSSTAAYIAFLYFSYNFLNKPDRKTAFILGLICGLGMLLYASSYLLPVFLTIVFLFLLLGKHKRSKIIVLAFYALVGFVITVLPFASRMYQSQNWYLTGRYQQVNLLEGEWSPIKSEIEKKHVSSTQAILQNFKLAGRAIYQDGIGGQGGYTFANLALFNIFTLLILIAGVITGFSYYKSQPILLINLIAIFMTFVFGMVLTIPPPPFHRISLIFPGLAIVVVTFFDFLQQKIKLRGVSWVLILSLTLVWCFTNQLQFDKSVKDEAVQSDLQVIYQIRDQAPNRHLLVMAFPYLAFEKFCLFYQNCYSQDVFVDYHINILNNYDFKSDQKYVLYVFMNSLFQDQLMQRFPEYNIIYLTGDRVLMYN